MSETPNNSKIRFNDKVTNINVGGEAGGILEEAVHKALKQQQQCGCSASSDENSKSCNNSNCNNSASGAVVQDGCNNNNNNSNTNNASSSSVNGGQSATQANNQRVREGSKSNGSNNANVSGISKDSILSSIPKDTMEKIKEWKVKYAFITKGAKLVSTSKQHKFKTPVSIGEAAYFLAESQVKDSTLVFSNDNSLIFSDGIFVDLDLIDDDDD
ncbi:hypothetical protein DFA_08374 [Cavenderia fasciculata]|uniref:Uncharacterized protein n=1 Tax=Cavenderia fasciculata TaxID=261658 RepID=F4Q5X0_CACFS|nr:uncharacterized protein DFA_08374 [Cavenderia fasciculata]EGG17379.1 hypothetical protein DFA_08374 [Cavenderia fasciculata]|eukprot:XP_004355863.1 hypothetical protein DFA_08374 [Cavenderia fasciculata]